MIDDHCLVDVGRFAALLLSGSRARRRHPSPLAAHHSSKIRRPETTFVDDNERRGRTRQPMRSEHARSTTRHPRARSRDGSRLPFNDRSAQTRGRETLAARTFERGLEPASNTSGKGAKSPEKRRPGRVSGPAEGECTRSENAKTTTSSTKRINGPGDSTGSMRSSPSSTREGSGRSQSGYARFEATKPRR